MRRAGDSRGEEAPPTSPQPANCQGRRAKSNWFTNHGGRVGGMSRCNTPRRADAAQRALHTTRMHAAQAPPAGVPALTANYGGATRHRSSDKARSCAWRYRRRTTNTARQTPQGVSWITAPKRELLVSIRGMRTEGFRRHGADEWEAAPKGHRGSARPTRRCRDGSGGVSRGACSRVPWGAERFLWQRRSQWLWCPAVDRLLSAPPS